MEPVRPEYAGPCVTRVVNALASAAPEPWVPDAVRDAAAVVLLVVDGLGWPMLQSRHTEMPTLAGLRGGPITTVAPSTTAVALTSLTTGLAPAQHGVTGYRMRIGTDILNVLRWKVAGSSEAPEPKDIQPRDAFGGRHLPAVTRKAFANTGFSECHLRGARHVGWSTTSNLVEACRGLVASGERFVYAYYDGLDVTGHERGLRDGYWTRELAFVDALVAELLDALPESVAVAVCSDHGHVHTDEKLELGALASMVAAYGGDSRFRELHAKPGAAADLLAAARDRFASVAWVMTRDELFDDGWLGTEPPSPVVRRRVGDVVLAARAAVTFVDPTNQGEAKMLSGHGSLTADEMLVPLVAGRGTGT